MTEHEKLLQILANLRNEVSNLSSRLNVKIGNINNSIEQAEEDCNFIPQFVTSSETSLAQISNEISELEEKLSSLQDTIKATEAETEMHEKDLDNLKLKENEKREYNNQLEKEIEKGKEKNTYLEIQMEEEAARAQSLQEEYTKTQVESKEELEQIEMQIQEANDSLLKAKEENKLIVYLMESGLMDVPEAEIISVIASTPEGLSLDELKQKVNIPSVRVQPTINNLLEKILVFDPRKEVYQISAVIQEELNR